MAQLGRSRVGQGHWSRRWIMLALPMVLLVAACSSGKSTVKVNPTTGPGNTVTGTVPPDLQLTPIPGDYSIYIDPTWGYSFEYPSNWIVTPSAGLGESNVAINEPYTTQNISPDHPDVILMVRATADFTRQFVQQWICSPAKTLKVAGYPATDITTDGGSPTIGYGAPAYGTGFSAKGLAFEIWLQSSAKGAWQDPHAIGHFFAVEHANWVHVLNTFKPGPGATSNGSC